MIEFNEALARVLAHTKVLNTCKIDFSEALGYFLGEEVKANEPSPLFDNSAMDGFAVRWEEVRNCSKESPTSLKVIGEIAAGKTCERELRPGSAVKIFTGAQVPAMADAVVMKEDAAEHGEQVQIFSPVQRGENIRRRGEELAIGDVVFSPGIHINPAVLGMLAALGHVEVVVHRKPHVVVISTGDELRPPGESLAPGQIRDSNSFAIRAALRQIGIPSVEAMHCGDDKRQICDIFTRAFANADVIISSGGVSVGDYDFVKEVLAEFSVVPVFDKVAMKPGKPNFFGTRGEQLVFGLPGNPVSSMVSFYTLVRPALAKMMGKPNPVEEKHKAIFDGEKRKKPGRLEFIRGSLQRNRDRLFVTPTRGQGSHMLSGLATSNCLICFESEKSSLVSGDSVEIIPLDW